MRVVAGRVRWPAVAQTLELPHGGKQPAQALPQGIRDPPRGGPIIARHVPAAYDTGPPRLVPDGDGRTNHRPPGRRSTLFTAAWEANLP
jgi:hypothetical protein